MFIFIQNSYQHIAKIVCDSVYSCEVSGVHNTTELKQLRNSISYGVFENYDQTTINISQIQTIKFVNSSFNEIPVGFFNESLFKELKKIDVSSVGLTKFNLKVIYVGKINFVDIQNNNLKTIEMHEISLPFSTQLINIEIDNNKWECLELSSILARLKLMNIFAHTTSDSSKTRTTNILGIKCICNNDHQNIMKLNELIDKFNENNLKDKVYIKDKIQEVSREMENMKTRFDDGSKKMKDTLLIVNDKNKACNHSEMMDLSINTTSQNIEDILVMQNQVIFDSYIFKVLDESYEDMFIGYENILKTLKYLKNIIVPKEAAVKTNPKMVMIIKIVFIILCFVVLLIGALLARTRIRNMCSSFNSNSKSFSVSYSTLNQL